MKERPILFNGDMVRAILEGRKTQTRRVIKKPEPWQIEFNGEGHYAEDIYGDHFNVLDVCPYGKPGDRLWVRERFRVGAWREDKMAFDYFASPDLGHTPWCFPKTDTDNDQFHRLHDQTILQCEQAMDDEDPRIWESEKAYEWEAGNGVTRWRPSIHMPRWASRITLEIAEVRVERLQNISEEDAIAEGVPDGKPTLGAGRSSFPRSAFCGLWDSINGKPRADGVDISWSANPWVWVVGFQRLENSGRNVPGIGNSGRDAAATVPGIGSHSMAGERKE